MNENLNVKEGKLYYGKDLVGTSANAPGFSQYIFDKEPLGQGANGVTYGVKHKLLGVRQVVKIYFPRDEELNLAQKAKEESIKNANAALTGIIAITFDAGEYNFPRRLWYSIMESVTSYSTIKEWRRKRNFYFTSNKDKFNVYDPICQSSIHTSLNLAAGFLQALIGLYENDVIHGDLNPGNILWVLKENNIEHTLKKYSSYSYSTLGELEPYCVKLIDMGTSKANAFEKAGFFRDSQKLYEHMKSLLSPLFTKSNNKFTSWFNFELLNIEELHQYGVDKICAIKDADKKIMYINPKELAGDCFRLVCVLTIALGYITNRSKTNIKSLTLENEDIRDFYVLMYKNSFDDAIKAISFDSMITLQKLSKLNSSGRLINWNNIWKCYPLNIINASPIIIEKKSEM